MPSHEFRYASGGHNPALVLHSGGAVTKLASTGTLVGIQEEAHFDECTIKLLPHDRLLVYSDGIIEAENPVGEQFGEDRLIRVVQEVSRNSIQETVDSLMTCIEDWANPNGLRDDASCLGVVAMPREA